MQSRFCKACQQTIRPFPRLLHQLLVMYALLLTLHILGATVWTGGHLVLAFTVMPRALRAHDPRILLDFEQGYEKIGMPALALQIITGLWLAARLQPMAHWLDLQQPASHSIAHKLLLLALTALVAAHARLRVIPHLNASTLPLMAWHVRIVTLLSVLFVGVGVGFRIGGWF